MRAGLLVYLFMGLNFIAFAQKRESSYYLPTSKAIANVSSQWKLDSIGTNRTRYKVFDDLKYSKVDSISKEYLFGMLGKPNQISRFFSGIAKKNYIGFIYYVLCMNDYPKEKWFCGPYIEFVFDKTKKGCNSLKKETSAGKKSSAQSSFL